MKSNAGQILLHLIGGVIFLSIPFIFWPVSGTFSEWLHDFPSERELIAYVLLLGFFYLNFFVIIPKLYFNKKYIYFFLVLIVCYLIISFLPRLIIPFKPFDSFGPPPPRPRGPGPWLGHHFFSFVIVFLFSLTIRIHNQWRKTQQEKLNAELSYLKAQINPHFLFNTLNSIYSLAIVKSDETATAIVKLSSMMRYVITEAFNDFVSLEKEITYLKSYVDLQRLRFGDSIKLVFIVDGDMAGKKIAPLVLIPFVENAFKHGVNAEEHSDLRIEIKVTDKQLALNVKNNKVMMKPAPEQNSGLGIENTRNRLNLLYPARHTLSIQQNDNIFFVSLVIDIE